MEISWVWMVVEHLVTPLDRSLEIIHSSGSNKVASGEEVVSREVAERLEFWEDSTRHVLLSCCKAVDARNENVLEVGLELVKLEKRSVQNVTKIAIIFSQISFHKKTNFLATYLPPEPVAGLAVEVGDGRRWGDGWWGQTEVVGGRRRWWRVDGGGRGQNRLCVL